MARTLTAPIVSVDLSGIVSSSIQTAQAARRTRMLELETEFQKAVADGLSYDDQLKFLDKQLSEEKESSLRSEEIESELVSRVTNTKKLARFNKYRTNYQNILSELKAGRATGREQLLMLENQLSMTDDPDLRLEIEGDITEMKSEVKNMEDTMVSNSVKRAQYDGTERVLNETIDLVKSKRASSVLEGREDETSGYDVWLTTLGRQLSETKVNNSLNDITVRMNTKGVNALSKVDEMNSLIRSSDASTPITVDGTQYNSAQAYWTATRDAYLAGNGSGNFSDFFKELDSEYTEGLNATIRRDGLVTTMSLDRIANDFSNLKSRPELAPFMQRADNYQSLIIGSAIESTAKAILDRANVTGDFIAADATLQSYGKKYNIDVETYRLPLAATKEQRIAQIASATGETPEQVSKRLGVENILTPEDKGFQIPGATPPATPGGATPPSGRFAAAANYNGGSIVDFLNIAGMASDRASRAAIAAERGIQNYTGSFDDNVKLLTILKQEAKSGASPVPPAPTPEAPTPPAPPGGGTPPAPAGGGTPPAPPRTQNVPPSPTQPVAPGATPPAAPVPPKPVAPVAPVVPTAAAPVAPKPLSDAAKNYKGSSIVDFLSLAGEDVSQTNRGKLAVEKGIVTDATLYKGSSEQNTALLKKLRGY